VLIDYVWASVLTSILNRPFSTRSFHTPSPFPTPDVSMTVIVPSDDSQTLADYISLLMSVTDSGITMSMSRPAASHNTRSVRTGINDRPPL